MNVPFLDLKAQHAPLKADILAAWGEILDTAGFVGGKHVQGLEADLAAACGSGHACAVSNGTEAIVLALRGLGVGPGDEVIVPANTFIATAEGVSLCGATPVFVDCLRGTWNLDPAAILPAVTPCTKGVIGVHLYGQPFDVDACRAVCDRAGLWLLEDNAQGILATYKGKPTGGLARAAATSFYPGKNLGACGEGGAVMTSDAVLDAAIRRLREHGQAAKYYHEVVGTNGRLASVQAAALRVKMPHLAGWSEARRRHARRYLDRLAGVAGVELPVVAAFANPVWHLFVVHVGERDKVLAALQAAGVGAALHYPVPCHLQNAYAHLGYAAGEMPNAEYNAAHCLSLPMFPELTDAQIDYVCDQLARAVGAVREAA
ncbi:MAG: DegT/DnrJ/EryC1/StrS family aminotransferase [Myxococcales bacterium]|nr:DegT/DnrJ/EryC1/StrS family aminotransferase [Myxococcales bacterium]